MWFEEKLQGTRNQRMKLDQEPWSFNKLWRKGLTHFSWLAFSVLTALIFVGYFTPVDQLFIQFFTFEASFWAAVSVWFLPSVPTVTPVGCAKLCVLIFALMRASSRPCLIKTLSL